MQFYQICRNWIHRFFFFFCKRLINLQGIFPFCSKWTLGVTGYSSQVSPDLYIYEKKILDSFSLCTKYILVFHIHFILPDNKTYATLDCILTTSPQVSKVNSDVSTWVRTSRWYKTYIIQFECDYTIILLGQLGLDSSDGNRGKIKKAAVVDNSIAKKRQCHPRMLLSNLNPG